MRLPRTSKGGRKNDQHFDSNSKFIFAGGALTPGVEDSPTSNRPTCRIFIKSTQSRLSKTVDGTREDEPGVRDPPVMGRP
jgi:hypothetical protein